MAMVKGEIVYTDDFTDVDGTLWINHPNPYGWAIVNDPVNHISPIFIQSNTLIDVHDSNGTADIIPASGTNLTPKSWYFGIDWVGPAVATNSFDFGIVTSVGGGEFRSVNIGGNRIDWYITPSVGPQSFSLSYFGLGPGNRYEVGVYEPTQMAYIAENGNIVASATAAVPYGDFVKWRLSQNNQSTPMPPWQAYLDNFEMGNLISIPNSPFPTFHPRSL